MDCWTVMQTDLHHRGMSCRRTVMPDICFVGLGVFSAYLLLEPFLVVHTKDSAVSVQSKRCVALANQHSQAVNCAVQVRLMTDNCCTRKALMKL